MKKLLLLSLMLLLPLVSYAGDSAITGVVGKVADSLTNNPADCAANQFATSIDTAADLSCAAIVDADVPDTITVDLAAVATSANAVATNSIDVGDIKDGTDGELITWSAAAVATTVAVGTSGQVLTSGGVGVAPTFADAGGGATTFVGSSEVTSTNVTVDITIESDKYYLVYFAYNFGTGINHPFIRFNSSSGASYAWSSTHLTFAISPVQTFRGDNSDNELMMVDNTGNNDLPSGNTLTGYFHISTDDTSGVKVSGQYVASGLFSGSFGGQFNTAATSVEIGSDVESGTAADVINVYVIELNKS